jgi:hypothetical protein
MTVSKAMTWKDKAVLATRGSKFGAIIKSALGLGEGENGPRFSGKASITSDGFVMCNFIDAHGELHFGAFVGDVSDLTNNFEGLSKHLGLTPRDKTELKAALDGWIGTDYRRLK